MILFLWFAFDHTLVYVNKYVNKQDVSKQDVSKNIFCWLCSNITQPDKM